MKERFGSRLLRIRNKFGVSQDEIAPHYGVKLGIYQKYESGKLEPEGTTLRKWIIRMELLEKLQSLPPLLPEVKEPTAQYTKETGDSAEKDRIISILDDKLKTSDENFRELMSLYRELKNSFNELAESYRRLSGDSPTATKLSQKYSTR